MSMPDCLCRLLALAATCVFALPAAAMPPDGLLRAPLRFEPNRGQADAMVRFLARGTGYRLFLTDDEAVMQFGARAVLRLRPDGARPAHPRGSNAFASHSHYLPLDGSAAVSAPNYARVVQHGRYPGIDLVWYGNDGQLEYDFVVAPRADPSQIALRFDGADALRIAADGDLHLDVGAVTLVQRAPVSYQFAGAGRSVRVPVPSRYVLDTDGRVRIALGDYDRSKPLVIDPVLAWASFLGGNGDDEVLDVAERNGFVYAVGRTLSSNFPTQAPLDGVHNGAADCFVSKFAENGGSLVYSTYIGGPGDEWCSGVAVDADGEVYLAGRQGGNGGDAFLIKLVASGGAAAFPPVLRTGSALDEATAVAVTDAGVATVVGHTDSADFPTTPGVAQTGNGPDRGAFAFRTSAAGAVQWSSYLDGDGVQQAHAVALDGAGNAYIAGTTTNRDPLGDGFLTKLDNAGALAWATARVNGSAADAIHDVVVDPATGVSFVAGYTESSDLVGTPGVLQRYYGGGGDAFVSRINAAGNAFDWFTLLGGPRRQSASALRRDGAGNLYVAGRTELVDPAGDVFLIKFGPQASHIHHNLQYGGSAADTVHGLAVAANGDAWLGGSTASADFATTPGAFDTAKGAALDGFVMKVGPELATQTIVTDVSVAGTAVGASGAATSPVVTLLPGDLVTVEAVGGSVNFNAGGPCVPAAFQVGPEGYADAQLPIAAGSACYSADAAFLPDPIPGSNGIGHAGLFRPQQSGIGPARFIGAGSETFTYGGATAAALRLGVNDQPGTTNSGAFSVRVTIVRNGSFTVTVPGNAVAGADVAAAHLKAGDNVVIDQVSGAVNFNTSPTCGAPGAYQTNADGLARAVYERPDNVLCYTNDRACADPLAGSPHAGLLRRVGGARTFVGAGGASFGVAAPQTLSLGINDCSGSGSTAPNSGGFNARITVTRPVPILSASAPVLAEGQAGSGTVAFVLTLAPASADTVTVRARTADRSAAAGSDYIALDQLVSFAPGETSKTVQVQVLGDGAIEPDETFSLELANPFNASTSNPRGIATIANDDYPTVSVAGATCTEGDAGSTACSAVVSLSAAPSQAASVTLSTLDGSAGAPGDYVAIAAQTITFAPGGPTSQQVAVNVHGDHLIEAGETFQVVLSNPSRLTLGTAASTLTIANDDAAGTIAVAAGPVTQAENAGSVAIAVQRSGGFGHGASVAYAFTAGSAAAPSDWTATQSGTLVFAGGETQKTLVVQLVDDGLDENDESFALQLSAPGGGASLGNATHTVLIADDDAAPSLGVDNGGCTAAEGSAPVDCGFVARLSSASGRTVTFQTATTAGSAAAGADFTPHAATARSIPAGQTTLVVSVPVLPDALDEDEESFTLNVTAVQNAAPSALTATGTITDDDTSPTLSVDGGGCTVAENGPACAFVVRLSAASGKPVSFVTATAAGSASVADFTGHSATVRTIAPGQTMLTVNVPVLADTLDEEAESFTLAVTSVQNAAPAALDATGTITDDDAAPALSVDRGGCTASESAAACEFVLRLSAASGKTVTFTTATVNDSAGTADFTGHASTARSIAPGQTTLVVGVPLRADALDEADETFVLAVAAVQNATPGTLSAAGTIFDDDAPPTLTVDGGGCVSTEGNACVFTLRLSAPSGRAVAFDSSAVADSATAGADFTAHAPTARSIAAGQTALTISVPTVDDALDEDVERFALQIASVQHAAFAGLAATGTVNDDDEAPVLSIEHGGCTVVETDAGSVNCDFVLRLSAPSGRTVTFKTATADGGANAGQDYTAHAAVPRTIAAGSTALAIPVAVLGDTLDEPNESFVLQLDALVNAVTLVTAATGTIVDDDGAPALSALDASVLEGDAGTRAMTFELTLQPASAQPVSVAWSTSAGSASSGDFAAASGTAVFAPGVTRHAVPIDVVGDTQPEDDETLRLVLQQAQNAVIGDGQATGTILDDDPVQVPGDVFVDGFEARSGDR